MNLPPHPSIIIDVSQGISIPWQSSLCQREARKDPRSQKSGLKRNPGSTGTDGLTTKIKPCDHLCWGPGAGTERTGSIDWDAPWPCGSNLVSTGGGGVSLSRPLHGEVSASCFQAVRSGPRALGPLATSEFPLFQRSKGFLKNLFSFHMVPPRRHEGFSRSHQYSLVMMNRGFDSKLS